MFISAPAIILTLLLVLGFSSYCYRHGQPRAPYHAGHAFVALVIEIGLLVWGGFYG